MHSSIRCRSVTSNPGSRICRKIHGLVSAARPIITPAQPVSRNMRRASSGVLTSPLPMMGNDVPASTALAMRLQSAEPSYCWARVRGWMARALTPTASNMRRKSR